METNNQKASEQNTIPLNLSNVDIAMLTEIAQPGESLNDTAKRIIFEKARIGKTSSGLSTFAVSIPTSEANFLQAYLTFFGAKKTIEELMVEIVEGEYDFLNQELAAYTNESTYRINPQDWKEKMKVNEKEN